MLHPRNYRNSIIVISLLTAALIGVWYSPLPDVVFNISLVWSILVALCVTGWDILQVIVDAPEKTERQEYQEAPPIVDKWGVLRQQAEVAANEDSFILSRLANKLSARSKSEYDPFGPITLE